MTARIIQLRSTLRRLRAVDFDRNDNVNVAMASQEILDFLAMLDTLKPVYLLGRGFDDPSWMKGVEAIANKKQLHVVRAPYWEAVDPHEGIPDHIAPLFDGDKKKVQTAVYICKGGGTAKELAQIAEAGTVIVDDEARLLGYPICCVRHHYIRTTAMNKAYSLMLQRAAGGNENEIRRLIQEDVGIAAETDEEKELLETASTSHAAPFTSIQMCPACFENTDSPARAISKRFEALAKAVDPELWREISTFQVEDH